MLSFDAFEQHLKDDNVKALLAHLDIDVSEASGLFLLLDGDGNGFVDLEEFLSGCMRLKGPAKQVDLALLLQESSRITSHVASLERKVSEHISLISVKDCTYQRT